MIYAFRCNGIKKISLLLASFCITLFSYGNVNAAPPPPGPTCYIKGVIRSVDLVSAHKDLPQERYELGVQVEEVSHIEGDSLFTTCEEQYPINVEQNIFVQKEDVGGGDIFGERRRIEGEVVSSSFSLEFNSYTLGGSVEEEIDQEAENSTTETAGNQGRSSRLFSFVFIAAGVILAGTVIVVVLFLKKKWNRKDTETP